MGQITTYATNYGSHDANVVSGPTTSNSFSETFSVTLDANEVIQFQGDNVDLSGTKVTVTNSTVGEDKNIAVFSGNFSARIRRNGAAADDASRCLELYLISVINDEGVAKTVKFIKD